MKKRDRMSLTNDLETFLGLGEITFWDDANQAVCLPIEHLKPAVDHIRPKPRQGIIDWDRHCDRYVRCETDHERDVLITHLINVGTCFISQTDEHIVYMTERGHQSLIEEGIIES